MRRAGAAPDDLPPRRPRRVRRRLPLLLFVEPDAPDRDDDTARLVGLRVLSTFAESTLAIISGPLSRERLAELMGADQDSPRSVAAIGAELGYDYVADVALGAAGGRWHPRLSIVDTGTGDVFERDTGPLGPFADTTETADGIAAWVVAEISECFFFAPHPRNEGLAIPS